MSDQGLNVWVGDRVGRLIGEVGPRVEFLESKLHDIGYGRLVFARTDPDANETFLNWGNRVYIQFENGLPPWGGYMDPPRKWSKDKIEVELRSGEGLFGWRVTEKTLSFDGASVGSILQRLATDANAAGELGIRQGFIHLGGTQHFPEYHFQDMWSVIKESIGSRLSSSEIFVEPLLEDGRILFDVHLYPQRGNTKPNVALVEGTNISEDDIELIEQGPLVNEWFIAGADIGTGAGGWGATRLTAQALDADSVDAIGLRQGGEIFPDIGEQETLDDKVQAMKKESAWPRNLWSVTAFNRKPGLFKQYDVGDIVTLIAPNYGFNAGRRLVRLTGRTFYPPKGTCELVIQEVQT